MCISLTVHIGHRRHDLSKKHPGLLLRQTILGNDVIKQLPTDAVLKEQQFPVVSLLNQTFQIEICAWINNPQFKYSSISNDSSADLLGFSEWMQILLLSAKKEESRQPTFALITLNDHSHGILFIMLKCLIQIMALMTEICRGARKLDTNLCRNKVLDYWWLSRD